jgi:hypothetical protein
LASAGHGFIQTTCQAFSVFDGVALTPEIIKNEYHKVLCNINNNETTTLPSLPNCFSISSMARVPLFHISTRDKNARGDLMLRRRGQVLEMFGKAGLHCQ